MQREFPSLEQLNSALAQHGSQRKAAEALGVSRKWVANRLKKPAGYGWKSLGFTITIPKDDPLLQRVAPDVFVPRTDLKERKLVGFSCVHAPFMDPDAVEWLLAQIANEQPDDIVHLGDGVESSAASKWPDAKELGSSLEHEYKTHGEFLRKVREAAPNATRYFLAGNHEDNIVAPGRIAADMRSLVDWKRRENQPELVDHWQINPHYMYDRAVGRLVLGQLVLAHGYEANQSSDELQALYLANEYGILISGHTHRPKAVTQVRKGQMPLRYWFANAGCLRDLSPHYIERSRKMDWGHACVVAKYVPITQPVHEKQWTAETRIKCLFDEWAEKNPTRVEVE